MTRDAVDFCFSRFLIFLALLLCLSSANSSALLSGMASASPRRPSNRKGRYSISRLSSDTTASLPVYSQTPHTRSVPNLAAVDPVDPPPQYQYEADADEESDGEENASGMDVVLPLSPSASARRRHSRPNAPGSRMRRPNLAQHRQRPSVSSMSSLSLSPIMVRSRSASPPRPTSPDDPYLDALLARSVQALEMSNALLQSSMSTQTSLAALTVDDSPPPSAGPSRMTSVPRPDSEHPIPVVSKKPHDWMGDMNDLQTGVNHLFDSSWSTQVSRSLPGSAGPSPIRQRMQQHNRIHSCSSTDLRTGSVVDAGTSSATLQSEPAGELHFGANPRSRLISPAPRAITQFVDCDPFEGPGDDRVVLPSTLGLRATGHTYHVQASVTSSPTTVDTPSIDGLPSSAPSRAHFFSNFRPGRPAPSAPLPQYVQEARKQPDAGLAPSAATLLSSFLSRRPSSGTANDKSTKPSVPRLPRRRASIETTSPATVKPISYHYQHEQTQLPHHAHTPSTPSSSTTILRPSRSPTPTRRRMTPPPPLSLAPARAMTPPIEVSTPSPDSDSSMSPPSDAGPHMALSVQALRKILTEQPAPPRRGLQPRSAVVPTVGTSHATASISRLFTRGTHMHAGSEDARIARRSALKQHSSAPQSPATPVSATTASSSFLGLPLPTLRSNSASSSGRSTPKRISFAALPDDTTGTIKGRRVRSRSRTKRRSRSAVSYSSDDGGEGWWTAWLLGGSGGFTGLAPGEGPSRVRESRKSSSWGRGFHGMEDFAV
ncbi:hypothetical protein K488DRAFT_85377 [Vararia minispora EC-137]|uniref:Uncharacterized protein n=1 Tax=Vararia minispora EC-137 TaxID=1314806 RepID=A0ACB8QMN0_9AGAM|nr:hypothetical protein K488DRAFT_85377 [Vararia minispora EC-137]